MRLARAALETIDLRSHAASHPRLGVVDHISCHPLGRDAALTAAAETARSIGLLAAHVPLGTRCFLKQAFSGQAKHAEDDNSLPQVHSLERASSRCL